MNERVAIPKKLRFEVLKRDKFTCTYCGVTAAQKLLHVDHVHPVAEGGKTTLLNLRTACADCNLGKGARLLSDDAVVTGQHKQLADLEERRQQLEMMRQWREELEAHKVTEVDIVADAIAARTPWGPNDKGRNDLRRLIKKHGLVEVLEAADESFDLYFRDGSEDDWGNAFRKIGLVISMREQAKADPHIRKVLYIQGIMRKRFEEPHGAYADRIRDAIAKGYPVDVLEQRAKRATSWPHYVGLLNEWNESQKKSVPPKAPEPEEIDPLQAKNDTLMEESLAAWHDDAWHIRMWATAFGDTTAGRLLAEASTWVRGSGYADEGKIGTEDVRVLRGMRAVGLIAPINSSRDIIRIDERGNLFPEFQVPPLSPREATAAFNRFGALKLGFWGNPYAFARVDEVH